MSYVQSVSATGPSVTLTGVTLNNALVGGVVWAGAPGSAPTGFTAATRPMAIQPFGVVLNPYLQLFYKLNAAAGDTTVVFPSFDNSVQASFLGEYASISSFDKGVGASGFGNFNPFFTPLVPALVGDTMVALAMCNGENFASSNFTARQTLEFPPVIFADFTVGTIGSYKAIFSGLNLDTCAVVMAHLNAPQF